MNVFNTTPYVFFPYDTSPAPTLPALTLIVRGTFSLPALGPAVARPKDEQKPLRGDEQHLDDLGRSLAYATDLVPMKPRGEVLVYATCHTPDSQRARATMSPSRWAPSRRPCASPGPGSSSRA